MKTGSLRFNPYLRDFAENPYEQYRQLRESDPVHKSFMGTWVLTRYSDISDAFKDSNFSSDLRHWQGFTRRYGDRKSVAWLLNRSVLNIDPPLHTEIKKALIIAFGPNRRSELTDALAGIVREQIETLKSKSPAFDAIDQFALPVPIRAVSHLYQVATEDIGKVKEWSVHVSGLIEPLPTGLALEDAERSICEFKAYLQGRLSEPAAQDCLPNRMLKILREGVMDEDHVLANLILMFPAGHETTINLIGNGLYTLLRHPEQMETLRRQPELINQAVEEILRYEPPQQVAWRSVLSNCEIGGKHIKKGDQLMMLLGSANRDPEVFDHPEVFDITRKNNPHISFGNSRHACLGAWFARMQGAIALSIFITEFAGVRLQDQKPVWYPTMSFHGLKSLPVNVG